jgi:alpha-beta hydrolase superfamily lysophospholipase
MSDRVRNDFRLHRLVAAALALAALAQACAPRVQEAGPRVLAPLIDAGAVVTADGVRLPLRVWLPQRRPRAVLVALHGFNDYGNSFASPAETWAAAGLAVYAYDQRGFGANIEPGVWPGTDALVDDLAEVTKAVRERHPGAPLYLVGVSMGAAVARAALARRRVPEARGAVLVAPAVWGRETMNVFYRAALWAAAHTVPWLKVTGHGLDITPSDNVEMLRALGEDPLVIKETRIDALWGMVNLMDAALAAAPTIDKPLLILYGARDEIIPKEPTARMLCPLEGRYRVAVYAEGYHMLLRDLQAEVAHRDVAAWIESAGRPLPSGAEADARDFFAC